MIERQLVPGIVQSLSRYPAVAILGPRQVGKTTLAREQLRGLGKEVMYRGRRRARPIAVKRQHTLCGL